MALPSHQVLYIKFALTRFGRSYLLGMQNMQFVHVLYPEKVVRPTETCSANLINKIWCEDKAIFSFVFPRQFISFTKKKFFSFESFSYICTNETPCGSVKLYSQVPSPSGRLGLFYYYGTGLENSSYLIIHQLMCHFHICTNEPPWVHEVIYPARSPRQTRPIPLIWWQTGEFLLSYHKSPSE